MCGLRCVYVVCVCGVYMCMYLCVYVCVCVCGVCVCGICGICGVCVCVWLLLVAHFNMIYT